MMTDQHIEALEKLRSQFPEFGYYFADGYGTPPNGSIQIRYTKLHCQYSSHSYREFNFGGGYYLPRNNGHFGLTILSEELYRSFPAYLSVIKLKCYPEGYNNITNYYRWIRLIRDTIQQIKNNEYAQESEDAISKIKEWYADNPTNEIKYEIKF